jgi:hypothetical protein
MAAASILKAVGHFRCCMFDHGWKSGNYPLNFIEIGRKLTELVQFAFFHDGGCRHLGFDEVTFDPKSNVYLLFATYGSNFVSISLDLTEL